MKKLNVTQMENLQGGLFTTQSLVCNGLGFVYGIANPFLGLGVGLACDYFWDYLH